MQAVEELEIENHASPASPVPWWEAAPFHGSSSFAGVLSAVAAPQPQSQLQPEEPAAAGLGFEEADDPALLSYESALRAPISAARAGASDPLRKSASIHIRLSLAESAQLRERAAEAGLTVSAYLRSCVLEAETLRAQVKQALAQLRAASVAEKPRRWWQRKS
jgi:hypothetical protein